MTQSFPITTKQYKEQNNFNFFSYRNGILKIYNGKYAFKSKQSVINGQNAIRIFTQKNDKIVIKTRKYFS